jgi:hypothetical protein
MTLTVAERARAPIIGLRDGLPVSFARYASSMRSLIALLTGSHDTSCVIPAAVTRPAFYRRQRAARSAFPSIAFSSRVLLRPLLEDVLCDRERREDVRPAGVEGEVREDLRGLRLRETVIHRPV